MLNATSSFKFYCFKAIEVQWPIAISASATSICQYCWIARILCFALSRISRHSMSFCCICCKAVEHVCVVCKITLI